MIIKVSTVDAKTVACMWWVMFKVLCLKCVVLSGSLMILVGIFLEHSDLFLIFPFGTSLWCGLSDMCVLLGWMLLGAAAGSPYIVFISTSGMLRSSDIYIGFFFLTFVPSCPRLRLA